MSKILLSTLFTFLCAAICFAQEDSEIKGGVIKYEAFDKFDLSYFKDADPKVKEWLDGMPKGTKSAKVFYFNENFSLFEVDRTAEAAVVDKKVLVMRSKLPYITPPRPELRKVFIDRESELMSKQMELMTRFFIIEEDIIAWDWKPGTEQVKILDYLCMSATVKTGDKTITAWFTPQIQTKAGPDLYGGLPGLILAIDINGENVLLATEVDLNSPEDELFRAPSEGKLMKSEAFQKLVDEKIEQYRAELENQMMEKNNEK
jgi:GLPGLI family protein